MAPATITGEEYVEFGGNYFDEQNKPKVISRMVRRLEKLGYVVTLTPVNSALPEAVPHSNVAP